MKKTVVVGISSGIAAYKTVDLVRMLKKDGIIVKTIVTPNTKHMLDIKELQKLTENKVYSELFPQNFDYTSVLKKRTVDHIEMADAADIFVVAPATANTIAKIAHGIADDFLTTTLLATVAPVIICPSMNVHMWENPIVSENIEKLRERGYLIIDPEHGALACGYEGQGRLARIEKIYEEIKKILTKSDVLKGKKILVTAGGTKEKIDDVRFITNNSSGKMGVAIAEECFLKGADVLLLRSKSSVKSRYHMKEYTFETEDDLNTLIDKFLGESDVLFHAAAVSDFSVDPRKGKISSKKGITLKLKPQKKILDIIKKRNPNITLIGFKAEFGLRTKDLVKKAFQRLQESKADVIVANDVGKKDRGFSVDTNEVFIVLPNGASKKLPLAHKSKIASSMVEFLLDKKIIGQMI